MKNTLKRRYDYPAFVEKSEDGVTFCFPDIPGAYGAKSVEDGILGFQEFIDDLRQDVLPELPKPSKIEDLNNSDFDGDNPFRMYLTYYEDAKPARTTVYFQDDFLKNLDELASKRGVNRSQYIHDAVRHYAGCE